MEEVINKPEEQFQDVLNDLIDFDKNSEEKSALIEEVCRKTSKQLTKPAASLNSSIYSSAASSSSSTSSASESSSNSASSSSTSSTLSSPSQSNQSNGHIKESRIIGIIEDFDNLEMPKMEDLGKTARILEHISSEHTTTANNTGIYARNSHSDRKSTNLHNNTQRLSSSASQTAAYKLTQLNQQASLIHNIDDTSSIVTSNIDLSADNTTSANSWKTMSGKRDKRRRKLTEQPFLSQHIPGHKGEQELDWLVKFIESGPGAANNTSTNSNKKGNNNKNNKPQAKRQAIQSTDLDRENQQRKPSGSSGNSNNKPISTQARPLLPQNKQTQNSQQTASMAQQSDQRKVQPTPNSTQSQTIKQQSSSQERAGERISERRESSQKPSVSHNKRSLKQKQDNPRHVEAVVTFADHIRVNEADDVGQRYTFGFFDEQKQQSNQVKPGKPVLRNHEESMSIITTTTNNTNDSTTTTTTTTTNNNNNKNNSNTTNNSSSCAKTNQVGQKHKMKHQKASLNSEHKRYKCNDNIDANSFNYHQILEFISNSWESTAKSHRLTVKHSA